MWNIIKNIIVITGVVEKYEKAESINTWDKTEINLPITVVLEAGNKIREMEVGKISREKDAQVMGNKIKRLRVKLVKPKRDWSIAAFDHFHLHFTWMNYIYYFDIYIHIHVYIFI